MISAINKRKRRHQNNAAARRLGGIRLDHKQRSGAIEENGMAQYDIKHQLALFINSMKRVKMIYRAGESAASANRRAGAAIAAKMISKRQAENNEYGSANLERDEKSKPAKGAEEISIMAEIISSISEKASARGIAQFWR